MSLSRKDNYLGTSINYVYYSKSADRLPSKLEEVLDIFKKNNKSISSNDEKNHGKKSDLILKDLESDLDKIGYIVESNKKSQIRISFDLENNKKEFRLDAINFEKRIIIEVEAGRAVANYQFLKDIFECSMISSIKDFYFNKEKVSIGKDKFYLVVAVRNKYEINGSNHDDFNSVYKWMNAIDTSKIDLNIEGILVIGY